MTPTRLPCSFLPPAPALATFALLLVMTVGGTAMARGGPAPPPGYTISQPAAATMVAAGSASAPGSAPAPGPASTASTSAPPATRPGKPPTPMAPAAAATAPAADQPTGLRAECRTGRPHVEIRNCMVARSKASTQAVDAAESELRQALDQRSEPHFKRAAGQADATARAFMRWRLQQCELAAGLVVGQALQREARLNCTWQLNQDRLRQVEAVRAGLPPG